ncbi:MAG: peptidoglycan DD-metalloendopeptidase family protein, partial [Roseiarcus sp.]
MRELAAFVARRGAVRVALTGLIGVWLAGCSVDSDRFSQSYTPTGDPFSNPFASNAAPSAAPTSSVASTPLAPPAPVSTASIPPAQAPYAPAPQNHVASSQPVGGSAAGWSIVGGSPIVVAQGDDAESVSRRYGVPTSALIKSNGLTSGSQIHAGMHLVIPVYSASGQPGDAKPKKVAAADDADVAPGKHAKAKGAKEDVADETPKAKSKGKIDAREDKVAAKTADKPTSKVADKPAAKTSAQQLTAKNEVDLQTTTAKKSQPDVTPTATVKPNDTAAPMTSAEADAAGVAPEFRWPARGRIIEAFKAGGNDGINIAVPEGTSVRAAESGVVAYAGDELKGYGNLVLIRHPNGFVTAYANNGELDVKRGETVKRGQIIAKSGQTGNVNSPQLHFELRKGSTPVDPTSYLAG